MSLASVVNLHSFATGNNVAGGHFPVGGLAFDSAGNLYGTTSGAGASNLGTVFELAAGTLSFSTLYTFDAGVSTDGNPRGTLLVDASGNLYGALANPTTGHGTVFALAAGSHAFSSLASFTGSNGLYPYGTLIADGSGNIFGTAFNGGAANDGLVFEIAAGSHTLSTLHEFSGTDGTNPYSGLLLDAAGNLYGTTSFGGAHGKGTVFELAAGSHTLTTLADLGGANGDTPAGGLVMDAAGNIYGTTSLGGANNMGTVFEIAAGSHTFSLLATFNGSNGNNPYGTLLLDAAGDLFGTTTYGGTGNAGTVFRISGDCHALTTLVSLNGASGTYPESTLVADAAGHLYGTAEFGGSANSGTVFEVFNAGFFASIVPVAGHDGAGVARMYTDVMLADASFAGASGMTQLYLYGSGSQYVVLDDDAEAAYTGGHIKLRDINASSFTVDGTCLNASATLDAFADHGVVDFRGGAEKDTFYFVQATWSAAGRTADGGGGLNNIDLTFTGTVTDASFAGIGHINELDLIGSSVATIQLGANALAAFGSATVKVAALNSAVINIDGHAIAAGYLGKGGSGADSFIGGAGNDSFYGLGGADLFTLGQGGHDRIYDFTHGADRIDVSAAGVHSLAGFTMSESGTEAVLTYGANQLRLNAVDYHALVASDFIFA